MLPEQRPPQRSAITSKIVFKGETDAESKLTKDRHIHRSAEREELLEMPHFWRIRSLER
jgi:hypothetical protein